VHRPERELYSVWCGVGDVCGATGHGISRPLLIYVRHEWIARCPSAAGTVVVGVRDVLVYSIGVETNRSELHDHTRRNRVDVRHRFVVTLDGGTPQWQMLTRPSVTSWLAGG